MLTLASMVWAAYMFCQDKFHMNGKAPPPVVISEEHIYKYNDIESAIYVPEHWTDSCYNQKQVVFEMATHFNNFRNGNQKVSQQRLIDISNQWVCVQ